MTMEFQNTIKEIKHSIEDNPERSFQEFNKFVVRHSLNKKLKLRALDLGFKLLSNDTVKESKLEMLNIINIVEKEYQEKFTQIEKEYKNRDIELNQPIQIKNEIVVQCKNVSKTLKSYETVLRDRIPYSNKFLNRSEFSLNNIDLKLKQGEITGVVGENSSGKTTLFRLITGELACDTGELTFPYLQKDKSKMDWFSIKQKIAYVPQHLPEWKGSLRDNLIYEASMRGVKAEDIEKDVEFIIYRLGLDGFIDKSWGILSGGYRLRFALAKALVWKPDLLVIDEPLAHLDIKAQETVLTDIRNLARSIQFPVAVIISSQHLVEIEKVADHLLFLERKDTAVASPSYYGRVKDYGKIRKTNLFLLETNQSLDDIKDALKELGQKYKEDFDLDYNSFEYIIKVPRICKSSEVIQTLLDHNIWISNFRDVSFSVMRKFKER